MTPANLGKVAHKFSDGNSELVRFDETVARRPDLNGFIEHTVSVAKVEESDFIHAPMR